MGACAEVAVVTLTLSESAHREERASPRKPKVRTEVRSENETSFEVWCFNAVPFRVTTMRETHIKNKLSVTTPIDP